jgi:hypothetical protein
LNPFIRRIPKLAAALAFTVSTTAAIMVGGAVNAGSTAPSPLSAAPKAADAAVFVGVGFGNYPRWRWDGYHRSWARYGFVYGRPGFVVGVGYVGYGPPVGPPYWAVRPVVYGPGYYGRPYYGHPFYGGPYYGRPFYGRGYYYGRPFYGRPYYGHPYYGRGYYGHGWRR